jgi:hypothetical protein
MAARGYERSPRDSRGSLPGGPHVVVLKYLAHRSGFGEGSLRMPLAYMIGHRPRLGIADSVHHQKPHPAVHAGHLEPGATVEHASRLLGFRARG